MLVEKDDKFMRNFELVTIDENVVNYAQDYESDAEKKKTDVKNDIEKDWIAVNESRKADVKVYNKQILTDVIKTETSRPLKSAKTRQNISEKPKIPINKPLNTKKPIPVSKPLKTTTQSHLTKPLSAKNPKKDIPSTPNVLQNQVQSTSNPKPSLKVTHPPYLQPTDTKKTIKLASKDVLPPASYFSKLPLTK